MEQKRTAERRLTRGKGTEMVVPNKQLADKGKFEEIWAGSEASRGVGRCELERPHDGLYWLRQYSFIKIKAHTVIKRILDRMQLVYDKNEYIMDS